MSVIRRIRFVADKCPKPHKGKNCDRCKYSGLIEQNRVYCYYYDEKGKIHK